MNTEGIIGHERQIAILGAIAASGTIPQTMVFSGVSGIGKKIIAKRFLGSLFCKESNPPCLKCGACAQVSAGTHPDLIELAGDGSGRISIGSQAKREEGSVRWLIDRLSRKSVSGRMGVIIDGAEGISTEGQNALLKTIEEPQHGAHIIIITSNGNLLLPTIMSRCTEIKFRPLPPSSVEKILGAPCADFIPLISGGSPETAIMLSDGENSSGVLQLCGGISASVRNGSPLIIDINPLMKKIGADKLLAVMINIYREILVSRLGGGVVPEALKEADVPDEDDLKKIIKILLAVRRGLSNNQNVKYSLKALVYSIGSIGRTGVPSLR